MKVNLQGRPGPVNCSSPPRRVVSFVPAGQGLGARPGAPGQRCTLVCPGLAISIGVLAPASATGRHISAPADRENPSRQAPPDGV